MNEDFRRIEYENLYKEISDNSARIYIILNICVPSTAALLGYAFTLDAKETPFGDAMTPFFLLLPLAIILPAMVFVSSSLNSTARVASYIKVFYEDETCSISWQNRMQQLRRENKRDGRLRLRAFKGSLTSIFFILGLVSITISIVTSMYAQLDWSVYVVYILIVCLLLFRLVALSKRIESKLSVENFEKLTSFWLLCQSKEKSHKDL